MKNGFQGNDGTLKTATAIDANVLRQAELFYA